VTYSYQTIGADLVDHAEITVKHFRGAGYTVRREIYETDFPASATLLCRRGHARVIVEIHAKVNMTNIEQWVRYAQSCSADTQIALVVPDGVPPKKETKLREMKVGLYISDSVKLTEKCSPRDLALRAALPELKSAKLRKLFGEAFGKFEGPDWRDGFGDAAEVVEEEARRYLKAGVKDGRLIVLDKTGHPKPPTAKQINRMTMGQLKDTFARVVTLNQADSIVYEVLDQVNPERIEKVHKKLTKVAEKKLRENVGQHMWRLVKAMRAMIGEVP
jgi:hypothetical protein